MVGKKIKIADFGLSIIESDGKLAQTHVGTPYTKAPEVYKGKGKRAYGTLTNLIPR